MDWAAPRIGSWPQDNSNAGQQNRRQRNQMPRQQQQQQYQPQQRQMQQQQGWQSALECFQQLQIQLSELQFQQHLAQQQTHQLQQQQQQDMQQLVMQQYSHFLHQLHQQEQQLPKLMRGLLDFRFDRVVQVMQVVKGEVKRGQNETISRIDRAVKKAVEKQITPSLSILRTQAEQSEALSTSIMSRLAMLEKKVDAVACSLGLNYQDSGEHQQSQVNGQIPTSPPLDPKQIKEPLPLSKPDKSEWIFSRFFIRQRNDGEKNREGCDKDKEAHQGVGAANQITSGTNHQNRGHDLQGTPEETAEEGEFSEGSDEETVPKQLYEDAHPTDDSEEDDLNELAPFFMDKFAKADESDKELPQQQKQQKQKLAWLQGKRRRKQDTVNYLELQEMQSDQAQSGYQSSQTSAIRKPKSDTDVNKSKPSGNTEPESEADFNQKNPPPKSLKLKTNILPKSQLKQSKSVYTAHDFMQNQIKNDQGIKASSLGAPETSQKSMLQQPKNTVKCITSTDSLAEQTLCDDEEVAVCAGRTPTDLKLEVERPSEAVKERDVENLEKDTTHAQPNTIKAPGPKNEAGQKGAEGEERHIAEEEPKTSNAPRPRNYVQDCNVTTCTVLGNNRCRYSFDLHIHDFSKRVNTPGSEVSSGVCHVQALHGQGTVWFLSKNRFQVWFTICKIDREHHRYHSEGESDTLYQSGAWTEDRRKINRSTSEEDGDKITRSGINLSKATVKAALVDPVGKLSELPIGQGSDLEWDRRTGSRLAYRLGTLRCGDVKKAGFTKSSNLIVVRFKIEMTVE